MGNYPITNRLDKLRDTLMNTLPEHKIFFTATEIREILEENCTDAIANAYGNAPTLFIFDSGQYQVICIEHGVLYYVPIGEEYDSFDESDNLIICDSNIAHMRGDISIELLGWMHDFDRNEFKINYDEYSDYQLFQYAQQHKIINASEKVEDWDSTSLEKAIDKHWKATCRVIPKLKTEDLI